jgi:DNA recombination protein RmuC
MLMLAVQTMQAIMKDVSMREQAGVIQREVGTLMQDVNRLRERVVDLQRHFGLANSDLEKVLTSAEKITARGRRIEALDLETGGGAAAPIIAGETGENGRSLPM